MTRKVTTFEGVVTFVPSKEVPARGVVFFGRPGGFAPDFRAAGVFSVGPTLFDFVTRGLVTLLVPLIVGA